MRSTSSPSCEPARLPPSDTRSALTLIELLVVIMIMLILMALISFARRDVEPDTAIDLAARELQATLLKARNLAVSTGKAHGVAFNIDNFGDGRVMWNNAGHATRPSGGHWYAIVGPGQYLKEPPSPHEYRYLYMSAWDHRPAPEGNGYNVPDAQEKYAQDVRQVQIGERHYLPKGVRFLALADQDFGCLGSNYQYHSRWPDEYPRPWFGVLKPADHAADPPKPSISDPAGKFVLYPWGGYDLDWEVANPMVDTIAWNGWQSDYARTGFNLRARLDPPATTASPPATWASGPSGEYKLVDAMLLDAVVIFYGDGRAVFDKQFWPQYMVAYGWSGTVDGKTRSHFGWAGHYPGSFYSSACTIKPMGMRHGADGMQHDITITGGYQITICRDIEEGEKIYPVADRYDIFRSEEDAIKSITPFRRIFVHRASGLIEVRKEDHPLCAVRMNQRNLTLADVKFDLALTTGESNRTLFRPAHRYIGFWEKIDPAGFPGDFSDGKGGWRGWWPPY